MVPELSEFDGIFRVSTKSTPLMFFHRLHNFALNLSFVLSKPVVDFQISPSVPEDRCSARFPRGLKLFFKISSSAKKIEVAVNEKVLVSKPVSKLLEDDIVGLWPTDRAKVKAEIRGWLEDSPDEQQQAPSEKDPSVREKTGASMCEIIGSLSVILSVGVAIYMLTYFLSLGLKSGDRGDEHTVAENYEL